jgi:hypothetical protein
MKRPRYRVAREHRASFTYAMIAAEGGEVSVGGEDPEMLGWFWCKDSKGVEMWVPSTHIDIEGGRGVFNQPYNSVELSVEVSDVVQYLGEALGWAECLDSAWRYGWVPMDKLTPA